MATVASSCYFGYFVAAQHYSEGSAVHRDRCFDDANFVLAVDCVEPQLEVVDDTVDGFRSPGKDQRLEQPVHVRIAAETEIRQQFVHLIGYNFLLNSQLHLLFLCYIYLHLRIVCIYIY